MINPLYTIIQFSLSLSVNIVFFRLDLLLILLPLNLVFLYEIAVFCICEVNFSIFLYWKDHDAELKKKSQNLLSLPCIYCWITFIVATVVKFK